MLFIIAELTPAHSQNPVSWRQRLQQRRAQRHAETVVSPETTVDLDSVRDALRTMKVDEVVDDIPEFPAFQHVLVNKL